jgi:hypothetical protein
MAARREPPDPSNPDETTSRANAAAQLAAATRALLALVVELLGPDDVANFCPGPPVAKEARDRLRDLDAQVAGLALAAGIPLPDKPRGPVVGDTGIPYLPDGNGPRLRKDPTWEQGMRHFLAKAEAYSKAAGRPPTASMPTVDDEDETILRTLRKAHPRRLTQDQIEARSQPRVSRRTISARMTNLVRDGLVAYPSGRNQGATITEDGLRLLGQIDSAKPAQ